MNRRDLIIAAAIDWVVVCYVLAFFLAVGR